MPLPIERLADGDSFDVVVVGAGGAGMSAALYAAVEGARVLLVESTDFVGGTTALSAGTTWIPCTHLAAGVNAGDTLANASTFLDNAVGNRSNAEVRAAFLAHGAAAVAQIEAHTHLKYRARPFHPDYLSELEGATTAGRALEPLPFDGRLLGDLFALVRPPIPEFTVLKGMMVDRDDISHLLSVRTSFASLAYATKIVLRHVGDRLRHPRGTRLVMGNALVGRLLLSLRERDVALMTRTQVTALTRDGTGVSALTLQQNRLTRTLHVRGGVILASGGFNRRPQRRAERLPGIADTWSPCAPGNTGTLHGLAENVGAHYGPTGLSDCFWAPVSLRQRADGSTATFPHFVFDRAKPHMLTVDSTGRRFLNESTSYHLFGIAMQAANRTTPCIPAHLITDADGMHKYGLGMVRPGGMGLKAALADGYVTRGQTLAELAARLGLPAQTLEQTVGRFNGYGETGIDPEFGRGGTLYQRANGDAHWPGPNPSLGTIAKGPFYAVQLFPGDIGAATGFVTDPGGRALDTTGQAIPSLYACGNDMQSPMGGVYPAPGITLGPGLVFAFLAARDAAARAKVSAAPPQP
jgi:succinate dehydrogenase/fumarate reductase flavoprotein subunit